MNHKNIESIRCHGERGGVFVLSYWISRERSGPSLQITFNAAGLHLEGDGRPTGAEDLRGAHPFPPAIPPPEDIAVDHVCDEALQRAGRTRHGCWKIQHHGENDQLEATSGRRRQDNVIPRFLPREV